MGGALRLNTAFCKVL